MLVAIVAVTASGAAYYRANTQQSVAYATAPVMRGSIVQLVAATGTLQAVTTVQVGSQVSGTIKALRADFNSEVKKGEVIAELDPSLFQTQVEQARASLVRLEADVDRARVDVADTQAKLERAEELSARQLISRADLDTARTAAQQAEAAVKSAQAQVTQAQAVLNQNQVNLDHTIIRAPIDGIVISRNVDVGQTVASSLQAPTLFVIANDLTRMQVNASIDESDIGRIAAGQPVTFSVDAYPGEKFSGHVSQVRLDPKVDSNVVSYTTIIDVPNPNVKLKPGMTATVSVETARADDVLKVPTSALRFTPSAATSGGPLRSTTRGGTGRVWILSDGRPSAVPVRAGISDGATTAVFDTTVSEGTRVITGTGAAAVTASQSNSPFIPQRRGGAGATSRAPAPAASGAIR